jgi:hypothetical protein
VTTKTVFRSAKLQPIYSEKTVKSHSPSNSTAPTSVEDCYTYYDYTVRIDYNDDCTSGTSSLTYNTSVGLSDYAEDFEITGNYTYLDNEELIFAIRGMTLTATQRVYTYNASTQQVETLVVTPSSEVTDTFSFEIDGEKKDRNITYYPTTVAKSGSNIGSTQTAWYAQNTRTETDESNDYRNVLLRLEAPISYNLGTLVYSLTKATFISA